MDVKQMIEMLEALLAKATPGEWAQYGPDVTDAEGVPLFGLLGAKEADDTALVVAMKAALPALLQLARAVQSAPRGVAWPNVISGSIEVDFDVGLVPCESGQTVALVPVPVCKCNFRQRMVGDGCSVCNPEYAERFATPEAKERTP